MLSFVIHAEYEGGDNAEKIHNSRYDCKLSLSIYTRKFYAPKSFEIISEVILN